MEKHISEIAQRIKGLREMLCITTAEMSKVTDVTEQEYITLESGSLDFPFTFLMKCSQRLNVDLVVLLTGSNPKLSFYTVVRKDSGLPINRRAGFKYNHLAYLFKNKLSEPFVVTAPYSEQEQQMPIHHSTHDGQEFDFILKGSLKVDLDGHTEILHEGDSLYYDSSYPHGMIATGGDCEFLAVVIPSIKK
jgi:mannose-6-phosphate isomerase-like protein (cupin superfamily)